MKRRIANNKNIQIMEQKDIDIYEILKDMPDGTSLYTPMVGKVVFTYPSSNGIIRTEKDSGIYCFDKNGRWREGGEVMLFPSNEMRDWSKFFKKGDVLEYKKENNQATCIFDSYEDDTTKLRFTGLYTLTKGKIWDTATSWDIFDWVKSDNPAAYIKTIEERLGGKLNRETLEIEKPAKEHRAFKPFDKVLVRSGDNCRWLPALFIRYRGVGFESRHTALPIHSGEPASFAQCISYDGNEYLAFTSDPF